MVEWIKRLLHHSISNQSTALVEICPPYINTAELSTIYRLVSVTIDSIHEVREGKKSEVFRRYADNRFDPNCCFSIYYGERVKSLDLVSSNGEEARTWITGLKYLMAGISDEDSLARRQRTRDQYPLMLPEEAKGPHT